VDNQSHIPAVSTVAVQRQAHMPEHSVGAALCHLINCGWHINDAVYRADGYAVVHRDYDCSAGFAIPDSLQPDRLSYLAHGKEHAKTENKDDGRMVVFANSNLTRLFKETPIRF
jgi:hypothetical protein